MAEETYQEVVDKIKEEKDEKDETPPGLERSETVIEENDENETTELVLETKPIEKVSMKKNNLHVGLNYEIRLHVLNVIKSYHDIVTNTHTVNSVKVNRINQHQWKKKKKKKSKK